MRIASLALPVALAGGVILVTAPRAHEAPVSTAIELFAPGVISTRDYERDGTFSPDGKTFYFTKRTIWPYFSAICVSHLRNGHWSEPEVAPFSGQYADVTPSFSVDGAHLYFASHRPANGTTTPGYSIWVMDRDGNGWLAPRRLPSPINDHGSVISPVVTRNGSIYFLRGDYPHTLVARVQGDGWAEPVLAGEENAPESYETGAFVDPDEHFMIVAAIGRADAIRTAEAVYARADLYVRERVGSEWGPLRHLDAPVNSAADEGAPFLSPDGRYLYFMSERGSFTEHGPAYSYDRLEQALHSSGNGLGDIYRISVDAAGIRR